MGNNQILKASFRNSKIRLEAYVCLSDLFKIKDIERDLLVCLLSKIEYYRKNP
jgi:hypothetical protein